MIRRLLLPLVLLVAACDSSDDDPPRFGSFSATVSGDMSLVWEGDAPFTAERAYPGDPPGTAVTVLLLPRTSVPALNSLGFSFFLDEGEQLEAGTYAVAGRPLGTPDEPTVYVNAFVGHRTVFGQRGEVRVTRADDERIEGTFDVEAAEFPPDSTEQPVSFRFEGTFASVPLDGPGCGRGGRCG